MSRLTQESGTGNVYGAVSVCQALNVIGDSALKEAGGVPILLAFFVIMGWGYSYGLRRKEGEHGSLN